MKEFRAWDTFHKEYNDDDYILISGAGQVYRYNPTTEALEDIDYYDIEFWTGKTDICLE